MNLAELFVDVGYKDNGVDSGLDKTHGKLQQAESQFSKTSAAGSSMWKTLIGGAAFAGAALSLEKIISLTVDMQRAEMDLKSSLQATDQEVQGNFSSFVAFAEALRQTQHVSVDASLGAAALATNLGATAAELPAVIKNAAGLAYILKTDLRGATEMIIKAQQGHYRELERHLPKLKDMATNSEKLSAVQKLAAQGNEESRASLDTLGGAMQSLMGKTEDLGREIGDGLSPAMIKLAGAAGKAVDGIHWFVHGSRELAMELEYLSLKTLQAENSIEILFGGEKSDEANKRMEELNRKLNDMARKEEAAGDAAHMAAEQNLRDKSRLDAAYGKGKMSIADYWDYAGDQFRRGGDQFQAAAAQAQAAQQAIAGAGAAAAAGPQFIGGNRKGKTAQQMQSDQATVAAGIIEDRYANSTYSTLPPEDPVRRRADATLARARDQVMRQANAEMYDQSTNAGRQRAENIQAAVEATAQRRREAVTQQYYGTGGYSDVASGSKDPKALERIDAAYQKAIEKIDASIQKNAQDMLERRTNADGEKTVSLLGQAVDLLRTIKDQPLYAVAG